MKTIEEKRAYYDSVKERNFIDSMRLEGIDVSNLNRTATREELLEKWRKYGTTRHSN